MSRFDDFVLDARDLFGLNESEATDLAEMLEDRGYDINEHDWSDFGEDAADLLSDIIDFDEYDDELEPLDPYFPDDAYLDAGEEWEITADYGDD